MIYLPTPTQAVLKGYDDRIDALKKEFTFTDKTAVYAVQRFKKQTWFLNKFGEEAFAEELVELKKKQQVCLIKEKDGEYVTHAGLARLIADKYQDKVELGFEYPETGPMVWYNQPKFDLRYYQKEAVEKLIAVKHGSISLPTGSGKSRCVEELIKRLGLRTVVMAPTSNIALQLHKSLVNSFGERNVGLLGAGKKKFDKKIVVAIDKSLTNVKRDSKEWEILSQTELFIADESHITAAETLEEVCMGLFANTPYRFFVSATQVRNDGSDLLLNGVIGPIVYSVTLKQLVDEGFLAKPNFLIVPTESKSNYYSQDVLRMLKKHLYENVEIHKKFALMANKCAASGRQVLIMIDHVEQFPYLVGNLTHEFKFAHGPLDKKHKQIIDSRFHKSDNSKLVESFNNREFPILVGTSCISIGTDILPVNDIFNLQGGSSPIKFPQLVGRGTRKVEGKNSFNFFDPDIRNIPTLHRQTANRVEIYRDMYDNVRFL